MTKRTMLTIAMAALGFAALPPLSAANPVMELPENTHFTIGGETQVLETAEFGVECTSFEGTGEFESDEGGSIQLNYHGCTETALHSFKCTTEGEESGVIVTTELTFHLKTVNGEPAVLITASEEHIASFKCSVFVNVQIEGNGVIGLITAPGYEEPSNEATIEFKGTAGEQEQTTVDGDETEYVLETTINGGEAEASSESGEGTLSFAEGGEGTLIFAGLDISPNSWAFFKKGATKEFKIKNTGKAEIKDLKLTLSASFNQTGSNCTGKLAGGESCEVTIENNADKTVLGLLVAESKARMAEGKATLHAAG